LRTEGAAAAVLAVKDTSGGEMLLVGIASAAVVLDAVSVMGGLGMSEDM
jgi:hypothetical protein